MIPSALEHVEEIAGPGDRCLAIFLDYDGTLTPIVSDPEKALLSDSMRQTIRELSVRVPLAILSGRDFDDVRQRVNIDTIIYAGSHGFDIAGPGGLRKQVASEFLHKLDIIAEELGKKLIGIPGARVERKRFSIAAHYRNAKESDLPALEQALSEVAARHPELRTIAGKKVYELQPNIDWDKGRALIWLLKSPRFDQQEAFPIYIGDDLTDENAFRALQQRGAGILVTEQVRHTAASYSLSDPIEVERFLRALTERLAAL
jgi:trehalose-phosphatase